MLTKIINGLLSLFLVLIVAYVVFVIIARPANNHPFFTDMPPRPWVIAHQGGDGLWPGNTRFAFERAVDMGVDVLEMDLHRTVDGVLVLMQDDTVDRTTEGTGRISELTLGEIKTLDAGFDWSSDGGESFSFRDQGITVPTLEEVFTEFPSKRMNIEIQQIEPPIALQLCQLINEHRMNERVLVASFDQDTIEAFREACPEVATSTPENEVITFFGLSRIFLEGIYSPKAYALQVPEKRGTIRVLGPRLVRAAQGRNLEVHALTINDVEDMERLLDMGVDGIITDRPDRLLDILGR
jgi:glycerophosphoryl diester phosphodiesterase